ncbi:hypothetical protein BJY00DRAFT_269526 [Aspergillus carlsbadensis]|nr:hypothetical protein BJY00DRAFT_269526 [Aspergillus carlsbadensis]
MVVGRQVGHDMWRDASRQDGRVAPPSSVRLTILTPMRLANGFGTLPYLRGELGRRRQEEKIRVVPQWTVHSMNSRTRVDSLASPSPIVMIIDGRTRRMRGPQSVSDLCTEKGRVDSGSSSSFSISQTWVVVRDAKTIVTDRSRSYSEGPSFCAP